MTVSATKPPATGTSATTPPDAEAEAATARPALAGPGRAALRGAVEAEIARRNPKPVALRTLQLLAEAAVEPSEAPPGHRVVDRHGRPRRHAGSDAPLTLAELVDEIQARHPALFRPPATVPAEPEPEAAKDAKDASLLAGAAEMRAATARLVETGSERARALAERSTEQGRALAESAADRVSGVRAGMAAWLAARHAAAANRAAETTAGAAPQPASRDPASPDQASRDPAWREQASRVGASARDGVGRVAARLRDWQGESESVRQHRRWLAGGTAAALLAVLAAGLVVGNRAPENESPAQRAPRAGAEKPAPAAPAPDPVTPPPETADTVGLPEPPAPPAANAISGKAEVIDTATVRVAGKLMHLFGVEWVRGGQADELTKYLAGRPITCTPVPGSENVSCTVEGRDLSEVVLFNGGGRASPEASPELVAAEDHARTERIGVWKR
ncbi:nuclease [Methylobacterium sp. HMF5984]|uniref:nuclease n=1 Tax=Methylobacterium sp. HMF5984 TaxID=3367370 RepID=UPI0038528E6E